MLSKVICAVFVVIFGICSISYATNNGGYRPRNPSFGGNPGYGSYYLQKAKDQDESEETLKDKAGKAIEDAFISAIRTKMRDSYAGEVSEITTIKLNGTEVEIDSTDPSNITYTVY